MADHAWPKPGEHLFGRWYPDQPRRGKEPPTQYRACVHPECNVVERREAPRG